MSRNSGTWKRKIMEGGTGLALRAALAWLEVRSARGRSRAAAGELPRTGEEAQTGQPSASASRTATGEAEAAGAVVPRLEADGTQPGAAIPREKEFPDARLSISPGPAGPERQSGGTADRIPPERGEEECIYSASTRSGAGPSGGVHSADSVGIACDFTERGREEDGQREVSRAEPRSGAGPSSGSPPDEGGKEAGTSRGEGTAAGIEEVEREERQGTEEGGGSTVRRMMAAEREGARRIAERRAIPGLAEALRSSPDERDREKAARALGRIDDPRVVDPLVEGLRDIHPLVRRAAAAALGETGRRKAVEPLLQLLEDPDPEVRREAQLALVKIGSAALHPLVSLLKDEREGLRRAAAETLGMFFSREDAEPLALNFLISALRDGDLRSRARTATVLGEVGEPWVIKPLVEALYYYNIRETVRGALLRMGAQAVEPLAAALHHHHISVRRAAAEILGEIGDARAVAPLRSALKDKDWSVRKAAEEALRKVLGRVSPRSDDPLLRPESRFRRRTGGVRTGGGAANGA